jgi:hypothetical protein
MNSVGLLCFAFPSLLVAVSIFFLWTLKATFLSFYCQDKCLPPHQLLVSDARYLDLNFVSHFNSWFPAVKATGWLVLISWRELLGRQSEGACLGQRRAQFPCVLPCPWDACCELLPWSLERIKQFVKELLFVRLIFLYFLIEGEISVLLGLGNVSFREAGAIILISFFIRFGSAVEGSYREKVEL